MKDAQTKQEGKREFVLSMVLRAAKCKEIRMKRVINIKDNVMFSSIDMNVYCLLLDLFEEVNLVEMNCIGCI